MRHGRPDGLLCIEPAVTVQPAMTIRVILAALLVDLVAGASQDILDFVPAKRWIAREHQRCHARRPRAGTGGAAERIREVAGAVPDSPRTIGSPDPRRQRCGPTLCREVVTGKGAEDGVAEVAVDAASASVVAGGNGQYIFIASIAVVIYALVTVARREEHHAALTIPASGGGVVDRQTCTVGKRDPSGMIRVVGIPPIPVHRTPTTRYDIRAVPRGPIEGVCFRQGPQLRLHPDGHEPGPRRYAGCPEPSIGAGHTRTGRTVFLVVEIRPRIGVVRGRVSGGDDLTRARKLPVIYVDARVDDGDSNVSTLGKGVSSLDVRASTDRPIVDHGRLEVPLLGKMVRWPRRRTNSG